MPPQEKEAYKERLDNIHTVTLCKIHHFHESLKSDFKEMLQHYLTAHIAFHQQVRRGLLQRVTWGSFWMRPPPPAPTPYACTRVRTAL